MKTLYYFVTFTASLLAITFISWEIYMQWPAIEHTALQFVQKKCDCAVCPKNGCDNCKCEH